MLTRNDRTIEDAALPRRRRVRARRPAHRLQGRRRAVRHDAGARRQDPAAGRRLVSGSCEYNIGGGGALARSGARARGRPDTRRHGSRRRDAHPRRAVSILPVSRPARRPSDAGSKGTAALVAEHCRAARAAWAAAASISSRIARRKPTRSTSSAPHALRCRGRTLIVAGSVNSTQRIHALAEAGVDAFTIGSAVFDGAFSPSKGSFRGQILDILEACDKAPKMAA